MKQLCESSFGTVLRINPGVRGDCFLERQQIQNRDVFQKTEALVIFINGVVKGNPACFLQLQDGYCGEYLRDGSQIVNGIRFRFSFARNKTAVRLSIAFLNQAAAVLLVGTRVSKGKINAGNYFFFFRKDTDSF